jgi:hypothetical protein
MKDDSDSRQREDWKLDPIVLSHLTDCESVSNVAHVNGYARARKVKVDGGWPGSDISCNDPPVSTYYSNHYSKPRFWLVTPRNKIFFRGAGFPRHDLLFISWRVICDIL